MQTFNDKLEEKLDNLKVDILKNKMKDLKNSLPNFAKTNDRWNSFLYLLLELQIGLILQITLAEITDLQLKKIHDRLTSLSPFFEICQKYQDEHIFSLLLHYFLSLLAYPLSDSFDNDFIYYSSLLNLSIKAEPLSISNNLQNKIKSFAKSEEATFIYHQIDNCHEKKSNNFQDTRIHIGQLLDFVFDGKIYFIDQVSDNDEGETTFDCAIYVAKSFSSFLKIPNLSHEQFNIGFANLCLVILHEISHAKRIRYGSDNQFFRHSPKNIGEEAGDFFEKNLLGGMQEIITDEEAKIFLKEENWEKIGFLKEEMSRMKKLRKVLVKKKKRRGIRCVTSRHIVDPSWKYMIEETKN